MHNIFQLIKNEISETPVEKFDIRLRQVSS